MSKDDDKSPKGDAPLIDPVVDSPARLAVLKILRAVKEADFVFLRRETGLTDGNLSSHLARLEAAGYITIEKKFVGKIPRTDVRLTKAGRVALKLYQDQVSKALKDRTDG